MNIEHMLVSIALLVGLGGCGTWQSAEPDRLTMQSFTMRAGKVTPGDLAIRLPRVLARHGYTIERRERRGRRLYLRTQWKSRDAFDDEAAGDVTGAATRLRFSATWDGRWYRLRMEAENRLQLADGTVIEDVRTERFRRYLDTIAGDIRVSLSNTMRRY